MERRVGGIDGIPPLGLAKELVKVDWAAADATESVGCGKNMVNKTEFETLVAVSPLGFSLTGKHNRHR